MQTITTKALVSADRKLTIQLPADIPTGEYDIVLVLNSSDTDIEIISETEEQERLNAAFEKWLKEVEALPVSPGPVESDYQQHIIEKYRKQGLDV